jgi:hypothetical protein
MNMHLHNLKPGAIAQREVDSRAPATEDVG